MLNYNERNHTITLTRGDTGKLKFNFDVEIDGVKVTDYKATFHLKHNTSLDTAITIAHELDADGILTFTHDDTANLASGRYMYDIEIVKDDTYITFGAYSFVLAPDVG